MHYEMEDMLEQANEIQDALGRSYEVPDEIDEADLEAGKQRFMDHKKGTITRLMSTELDALELEVEEEGPSYLADLNKAPDFVDEAPVEVGEVRTRYPLVDIVLT
jgi:charged multivesicular body protein 5